MKARVKKSLVVDQFYMGYRFHNGMTKYLGKRIKVRKEGAHWIGPEGYVFTRTMLKPPLIKYTVSRLRANLTYVKDCCNRYELITADTRNGTYRFIAEYVFKSSAKRKLKQLAKRSYGPIYFKIRKL